MIDESGGTVLPVSYTKGFSNGWWARDELFQWVRNRG